jgi:hypothetical protein
LILHVGGAASGHATVLLAPVASPALRLDRRFAPRCSRNIDLSVVELAFVLYPLEGVEHLLARRFGAQLQRPGEVAALGIEMPQIG